MTVVSEKAAPPGRVGPSLRASTAKSVRNLGWLVGRSLFPLCALVLLLGTLWWGPWVTFALTFIWWRIVTKVA